MTTLAAFKRRIAPGVRLHIENHVYPNLTGETEVIQSQTGKFSRRATRPDGETVESWVNYPKAAGFTANDDGSVSFAYPEWGWEHDGRFCTITILED